MVVPRKSCGLWLIPRSHHFGSVVGRIGPDLRQIACRQTLGRLMHSAIAHNNRMRLSVGLDLADVLFFVHWITFSSAALLIPSEVSLRTAERTKAN